MLDTDFLNWVGTCSVQVTCDPLVCLMRKRWEIYKYLYSNPDHFHISIPPFKMGTIQLITHWQKEAPRKLLNRTEQKRALHAPENQNSGLKNHTKQNKTKIQRTEDATRNRAHILWQLDLGSWWTLAIWPMEERRENNHTQNPENVNTSTRKQNRNQKKRTVWHEKTGILELSNIWTCFKCKMQKQLEGGGKDKSTWTQDLELVSIKQPDTRTHLRERCLLIWQWVASCSFDRTRRAGGQNNPETAELVSFKHVVSTTLAVVTCGSRIYHLLRWSLRQLQDALAERNRECGQPSLKYNDGMQSFWISNVIPLMVFTQC